MDDNKKQRLIEILKSKGINSPEVLAAIYATPRDEFVPEREKLFAYEDHALPLAAGQTISQPYVVAKMTEAILAGRAVKKVLEIGTGSGYQAAVLSTLVDQVFSMERIRALYESVTERLNRLGYTNVTTRYGDGRLGWPEEAPFDGIIVTAGTNQVPEVLKQQLAQGGRLVIPIGNGGMQELRLITRHDNHFEETTLDSVLFVPLKSGVE